MTPAPRIFRLDDGQGTSLTVSELGATWLSCRVPLGAGVPPREVLLGRATPSAHVTQPGYMGAIVGRYANRIANARFAIDGVQHPLAANEGPHQLHGGPDGFDRHVWHAVAHDARALTLALHSPDGDQGYPGHLEAQVRYSIESPGEVRLQFTATVDRPCPVNLSTHAYFNLDGDEDPAGTIASHRIAIAASHWLPVNEALIPLGQIASVVGTPMDLRTPVPMGTQRFDHCYVLDGTAPAATVWSGDGRLRMTLETDYPGLHFYGGHYLVGTTDRLGRGYAAGAGFALEPEFWPDAPNHPEWPEHGALLRPPARLQRGLRLRFEPLASKG